MKSLIVFAKEPVLGQVKTRLAKSISNEYALRLYKAFVQDTIQLGSGIEADLKILAWTGEGFPEYLKSIAPDWILFKQSGKDLGERMHNAFMYAKDLGAYQSIVIGTDSPTLPPTFIEEAYERLSDHDMVIGPCQDGGYYLIGLRSSHPELFENTDWSTDTTMIQTLQNARALGKITHPLPQWFDVDTLDDLEQLRDSLNRDRSYASHTRVIVNELEFLQ